MYKYVIGLISAYGYIGLGLGMVLEFVGVPFPGEIVLSFAGFMIWRGVFDFMAVWGVVVGFSWFASIVAYYVGSKLGRPFILKYGNYVYLNDKKLEKVEQWFSQHGILVLTLGRFISGVRPLSAYVAGMTKMYWPTFAFLSLTGIIIWTTTYLYIGFLLGANWVKIKNYFWMPGVVLVVIIAGIALYLWLRYKRRIKEEK